MAGLMINSKTGICQYFTELNVFPMNLYLSRQLISMVSSIFTCHGCKYNIFHLADSMSVWNLLREFRIRQVHMAVVLNEYGGTIGVCPYETNPLYSVLFTAERNSELVNDIIMYFTKHGCLLDEILH